MFLWIYMDTFIINACSKNLEVHLVELARGTMLYNDLMSLYSLCSFQVTVWPVFRQTMVYYIVFKIMPLQVSSICFLVYFTCQHYYQYLEIATSVSYFYFSNSFKKFTLLKNSWSKVCFQGIIFVKVTKTH